MRIGVHLIQGLVLATVASSSSARATTWDFEASGAGSSPPGFRAARTGDGHASQWVVRESAQAPSGTHVLTQVDLDDTSNRYPVVVAESPRSRDVRVAVRCKAIAGRVDQACGVVARYAGPEDYYVARANALEDNVRLYHVKAGKRTQLASWSGTIDGGRWYEIALVARGPRLEVSWDGTVVLAIEDETFPDAGLAGLWLKADSSTEFDDLTVTPLEER
jgi:hypothetical protein